MRSVLAPCRAIRAVPSLLALALLGPAWGCATTETLTFSDPLIPSNHRNWSPDLEILPYAHIDGQQVTVHNIRNCHYLSDEDYIVRHYDKTFDLGKLQSVDFIMVPFKTMPALAHTMLSFGFAGEDYLVVSVEARMEEGEVYTPLKGALRQYELMYVVGDERDLIQRRVLHRDVAVYVYRTRATPEQSQRLLMDVLERVNALREQPEFYDTLTNNCTSNLVHHINRLRPGRVPLDVRLALPGFSDRLAYQLGLLATDESFEDAKRGALVNHLVRRFQDSSDFSQRIRR